MKNVLPQRPCLSRICGHEFTLGRRFRAGVFSSLSRLPLIFSTVIVAAPALSQAHQPAPAAPLTATTASPVAPPATTAALPATEAPRTFAGRYQGSGTSLMHRSGTVRPCTEIFLHFRRDSTGVALLEGGYSCEDLQASFPAFTLAVRDGQLYDGTTRVGTFTETRLELRHEDREEDFTYHWLLEIKDGKLSYLEEWTDAGAPALTIRGTLAPQN